MLFVAWVALLAWIPWSLPGAPLLYRQALFDLGGWGLLLWYGLVPRPSPFHASNPWLRVLLLWVGLRYAWDFWLALCVPVFRGAEPVFNWLCLLPATETFVMALLGVALVRQVFLTKASLLKASQWCCLLCASVAVCCLFQYAGFDQFYSMPAYPVGSPDWRVNSYRMQATFGNVSYVAPFLAMQLPLFLMFKGGWPVVGFLLTAVSLALMGKVYGVLGGAVGVGAFVLVRLVQRFPRKTWLIVGTSIGVLAASGVWGLTHLPWSSNPRWVIWSHMLADLRASPWWGFGIGAFQQRFEGQWDSLLRSLPPGFPRSAWRWAHNDWLQLSYEVGFVGLGLAGLSVWSTLKRAWRHRTSTLCLGWFCCALGCIVVSVLNFPWHFPPTAAVGVLVWSANEACVQMEGVA